MVQNKYRHKNTDYMSGYDVGFEQGRMRLNGKIVDRTAPEHLYEEHNAQRLVWWELGYQHGLDDREYYKRTAVYYTLKGERLSRVYSGHVSRPKIVSRLEDLGVMGDVEFEYFTGGKLVRTVKQGI